MSQLKILMDSGQFQQAAELAQQNLKANKNDKLSLLFLAQAQVKLELFKECQLNLNDLYKIIKKPQDDALHFQALTTQEYLCQAMIQSPNSSNATKQQATQIYLRNKFEIIDFLDKKQKYDKMLQEVDLYCFSLIENGQYKECEDNYVWLLNHQQLPIETKQMYGCRIFDIDKFYNPYTRFDNLFQKLVSMGTGKNVALLQELGIKMLDQLEKSNCKKSAYAAIQSDQIQPFLQYCEQIRLAGDVVFTSAESVFKQKILTKYFTKYIAAVALQTSMFTPEWENLMLRISNVCNSQQFQNSINDKSLFHMFLYSFLEITQFVKVGRFPEASELFSIKYQFTDADLDLFSTEYQEFSPLVNMYYAMCKLHSQNDSKKTMAKLNHSQFLIRKILYNKFKKSFESSDTQIYINCLKIKLCTGLDKQSFDQEIQNCEENFAKTSKFCGQSTQDLYKGIITNHRWQSNLDQGNWVEALKDLEQLANLQPELTQFVNIKSCHVQLINIDRLTSTEEEKQLFLRGLLNKLAQYNDSQSLYLQGYIQYTFQELKEREQSVTRWLMALKLDQTNPDLFYCLAVYYYYNKELIRATKCLDKALALSPNFEQAILFQYHLVNSSEQRLKLLDGAYRNAALLYLKGVALQNMQEYVQAIEMFQNCFKFNLKKQNKLLPDIEFPLQTNPIGIFQNKSQVWVHLAECFQKTDKQNVALKCFQKFVEEISQLQVAQNQSQSLPETEKILEILNLERFQPSKQEVQNDPILYALQKVQFNPYYLEGFMLGARLVTKNETSIHILTLALKCFDQLNWDQLEYLLCELIERITKIVQCGVVVDFGKNVILAQTREVVAALQKLIEFVQSIQQLQQYHGLQKKLLNAMFAVAKYQDEMMLTAMNKAEDLVIRFPRVKVFLLDCAKIIDEYQKKCPSDILQEKKMLFVKKSIMSDPNNSELWVHLHLFSNNQLQKQQAIFKAYELKPDSQFVQETIIKHFLNTQQWQKAFTVLVKSYQQQANLNEPQQPIVLAFLAFLNAKISVEDQTLEFSQRKQQLLEALSLCRLIQGQDFKQLLTQMYVYTCHFTGDYISTLKFLEANVDDNSKILLQQAYFGSPVYSYQNAKQNALKVAQFDPEVDFVLNVEKLTNIELLKKTQEVIQLFLKNPNKNSSMLALLQEICLQREIQLPDNLIDHQSFKPNLNKLNQDMQRILLIQSLRFVQLKFGTIPESQIIDEGSKSDKVINQKQGQSYLPFIIEASRLKPQYLTQNQHRNLLRIFLQSQSDPFLYEQPDFNVYNDSTNPQTIAKIQAIKIVREQKHTQKIYAQSAVMQNPLSLEANVNWVWSFFRQGKIEHGLKTFDLLQKRHNNLQGDQRCFEQLSEFVKALQGKEMKSDRRLQAIASIVNNLQGSPNPQKVNVADKIVKVLQKQNSPEVLQTLFKTLTDTFFEQQHFAQFNEIVKQILNTAVAVGLDQQQINQIWFFQGTNQASSLVEMKKLSQVISTLKQMEQLCKVEFGGKPKLVVNLLFARGYFALQQIPKLQSSLNSEEAALERDFFMAWSMYAQQAYKQYYLITMGLVAGCKNQKNQQGCWLLAYAYYLKSFAEVTFLAARKQNVVLQEDFSKADGEGEFDLEYFTRKATKTLGKCVNLLDMAGEQADSILRQAVDVMMSQI